MNKKTVRKLRARMFQMIEAEYGESYGVNKVIWRNIKKAYKRGIVDKDLNVNNIKAKA